MFLPHETATKMETSPNRDEIEIEIEINGCLSVCRFVCLSVGMKKERKKERKIYNYELTTQTLHSQ